MAALVPLIWVGIPVFFILLLMAGWQPNIQQMTDYLVGKGLALLLGGYAMWIFVTRFDRHTTGDWFGRILDNPLAVALVTAAVILSFGLIVAWS